MKNMKLPAKQIRIITTLIMCVSWTYEAKAQYVEIPDSQYVPGQVIAWFRPGVLNEAFLGCDEELSRTSGFPIDTTFIRDNDVLLFLKQLGLSEIYKLVPNINPCTDTISRARRGDTLRIPDFSNILLLQFPDDPAPMSIPNLAVVLTLFYQNAIKIAEPNFYLGDAGSEGVTKKMFWDPDDPETNGKIQTSSLGEWYVNSGMYGTEVYLGWDRVKGNSDITIGVIDNGITGKSASSADGHYDFGSAQDVVLDGFNYIPGGKIHSYNAGHGTRVASIIGALSNNEECIPGIVGGDNGAGNCKLIALKCGDIVSTATMGAIIPALVEASISSGAPSPGAWACDLVNISLLAPASVRNSSEIFRAAAAFAYANDVTVGVAMGNYSSQHDVMKPSYPADIDDNWVIAVGGSEQNRKAQASDFGGEMDILAPWSNYALDVEYDASTGAPINYFCRTANPNTSSFFSGTSSACPHVVGIAAMLQSYLISQRASGFALPAYLATEDIISLLAEGNVTYQTNNVLYTPLTKDINYGFGMVNAENALALLDNPYTLEHLQIPVGNVSLPPPITGRSAFSFPGNRSGASDTLYYYKKYYVALQNISYGTGKTYNGVRRVWSRGAASKGFPDVREITDQNNNILQLPIYRNANFSRVTHFTETDFDVETYLYEVSLNGTSNWQWLDNIGPNDVEIAISLLADGSLTGADQPATSVSRLNVSNAWPNPIGKDHSGAVRFVCRSSGVSNMHINVYDAAGRLVCRQMAGGINASNVLLRTDGLKNGVYYVQFREGINTVVKSFMVSR